jgi:hypothetical protein
LICGPLSKINVYLLIKSLYHNPVLSNMDGKMAASADLKPNNNLISNSLIFTLL